MINRFTVSCISFYYRAKTKLAQQGKGEDGMETLETVILIAVAVIIAGFITNFLTEGQFADSNNDQGLIGYMFYKIGEAIKDIFAIDTTINPASGGVTT